MFLKTGLEKLAWTLKSIRMPKTKHSTPACLIQIISQQRHRCMLYINHFFAILYSTLIMYEKCERERNCLKETKIENKNWQNTQNCGLRIFVKPKGKIGRENCLLERNYPLWQGEKGLPNGWSIIMQNKRENGGSGGAEESLFPHVPCVKMRSNDDDCLP
ncbi:MAG: hypothetical protein K0S60_497 [Evtepia sp.]|jgi:DNA-directed RNA polymerase subunit RPC12/RpoP|nr:hypothetical protein [Evtepia sp.]